MQGLHVYVNDTDENPDLKAQVSFPGLQHFALLHLSELDIT
jgi:hypothetical protein